MQKLGEFDSPYGTITILCNTGTGTVIYEQAGAYQSESDSQGVSLVAYIHALYGLICESGAKSVLIIGCAGGTLGTMMTRNGCSVTVVDVNPTSFPIAKAFFNLPESVRCEVADGRDFLLSDTHTYDAIVLDAYQGTRIPSHLQSQSFFRLARSKLTTKGALFVNVHIEHDGDVVAGRIVDCMANIWPEARLLDTHGLRDRNAIAMAGAVSGLSRPYLRMSPTCDANVIDAELAMMTYRDY